ncbi:MAG: GNAT family N-acetyltransferase, partial [Pseudomonadota bacterium]
AVLILALDGGRAVGASTALPLLAHEDASGLILPKDAPPADTIFYLAESVLEPRYRGRGLGHRFFDVREAAGRSQGFAWAGFASVIRPSDHPKRPKAARDLCPFWSGRGYAPVPNAYVEFSWTDIGDDRPTTKRLQYWMKPL